MKKSAKRHGKERKEKSLAAKQAEGTDLETCSNLTLCQSPETEKRPPAAVVAMLKKITDAIEKFSVARWVLGVYQDNVTACQIGLVSIAACLLITLFLYKEKAQ